MTKEDKKIEEENLDLESKLEEVQKQKLDQEPESTDQEFDIEELQNRIAQLEKEKEDLAQVAGRAQYDYLNLKTDFDRLQRIQAEKEKTQEVDSLIKIVKKFLPFVENLRKSLLTIPEDKKEEPLIKGLQIMYDNFIKTLDGFNIKTIESIGLVPDSVFHEPVNMVPTEDENMKGKIVQEWERGFYREKDGERKVVSPAKVIVGN